MARELPYVSFRVTFGGGLKATAMYASCGVAVGTWLTVTLEATPKFAAIESTEEGVYVPLDWLKLTVAPVAVSARFPLTEFEPGRLMVPPTKIPRFAAVIDPEFELVTFPVPRRARFVTLAEAKLIAAETLMLAAVLELPTRRVLAVT